MNLIPRKYAYSDEELAIAKRIKDSRRGSYKKAADYLDCCPNTAKSHILEYELRILREGKIHKEDRVIYPDFNNVDAEKSAQ